MEKQKLPVWEFNDYKDGLKALAPLKAWKMYTELCEFVKELYGE